MKTTYREALRAALREALLPTSRSIAVSETVSTVDTGEQPARGTGLPRRSPAALAYVSIAPVRVVRAEASLARQALRSRAQVTRRSVRLASAPA